MKTTFTLLCFALLCIVSGAATIGWGSNGTTYRFFINGTTDTSSANRLPTGSMVALVYLDDGESFTFDNTQSSYSAENNGITGGTLYATLTLTSGGKGTDSLTKPFTELNGNYGMLFFDATSWEGISAGTKYGMTTEVSSISLASENAQVQNAYLTSNVSLSGAITPVPEPATGALALAGIALLFKRRKARA